MSLKKKRLYKSLLGLFAIYTVLALFQQLLQIWYPQIFTQDYEQSRLYEMLQTNFFKAFVLIIIAAPVFEEFLFRSLLKPSHLDVVLFGSSIPVYATRYLIPEEVNWIVRVIFLFTLLSCLTYIGVQLFNPYKVRHLRVWLSRNYKIIWILTSVIFGLIHINNYVAVLTINFALILLSLPRIASGFIFGHIKLKNGHIIWPVILHVLNNLIAFTLMSIGLFA